MNKLAIYGSTILLAASAVSAQSTTSPEMQADLAHRDTAIHWSREFDPAVAPVFSHNELLIHTDCHCAFSRLADAPDWPNWVGFLKNVSSETPGPIGQGTLLRLTIFGSTIQSRIVEFVPDQRISWMPFGSDETETRHGHFHTWHFIPEARGCRVVTEEIGIGPATWQILQKAPT